MTTRAERKALLYFAGHRRPFYSDQHRRWREWWQAIDLLPDAWDMPPRIETWAPIALSMAYEGRPARWKR